MSCVMVNGVKPVPSDAAHATRATPPQKLLIASPIISSW